MSDEDDTLSDDAVPPTTDDAAASPADEPGQPEPGDGVRIPAWLAGALVVVLALVLAGTGFAIGRATAPGDDERLRVPFSEGEARPRALPFPDPGDGPPGFEPGGPGPRGRSFEDERGDGSGSKDSDQGTSTPPGVPEAVPRVAS